MKFKYFIELNEGYKPAMQQELVSEIEITIEAKNRVTADRAIRAMLENAPNIKTWNGICIED